MQREQGFEPGVGVGFEKPALEAGDEEFLAAVLFNQQRDLFAHKRRAGGGLLEGDFEGTRGPCRAVADGAGLAEGKER